MDSICLNFVAANVASLKNSSNVMGKISRRIGSVRIHSNMT